MTTFEVISQAFRALLRNRLRTALTLLGVAIGIAAVLAMVSISDGATQIIVADLETFQGGGNVFDMWRTPWVTRNGRWQRSTSPEHLTYQDLLAIERECPSVEIVRPRWTRWGGVRITAGSGMDASEVRAGYHGVTHEWLEGLNWRAERGRFIDATDDLDMSKVVAMGASVASDLFGDEDAVGQEISVAGERLRVVGVMQRRGRSILFGVSWDDAVYIPLRTTQQRLHGEKWVDVLSVHAVSPEKVPDAIAEVKSLMARRHGDPDMCRTWRPGARNVEFVTGVSSLLRAVLGSIAAVSLFVGGVGAMNMMLISVTERTKEIGLRRAVGARPRDIFTQFLAEALAVCLTGGVAGVALGVGFAWVFARAISDPRIGASLGPPLGFDGSGLTWPFSVSLPWGCISMAVSLGVGLFFGLYPATRAAKLTPIEALRRA